MERMKRPDSVGKDFDEYAKAWQASNYGMATHSGAAGLVTDESRKDEVLVPGDEWGTQDELRALYRPLFHRLLGAKALQGHGSLNVLEIGAGGGRSTEIVIETLGEALGEYHVVDVSEVFTRVLTSRIQRKVDVHIVDDVDFTALPTDHFHLCLAQSSWSHISLYDQYRQLRELRRVMKHGGPVVVSGVFLLGAGNDWTWNRFRRRVHQIEQRIEGVYHEFTSADGMAEMLLRLQYDIEVIASDGFVARSRQRNPQANIGELSPSAITYPSGMLMDLAEGRELRTVTR